MHWGAVGNRGVEKFGVDLKKTHCIHYDIAKEEVKCI